MSEDPLFAKYPDMSANNYCGGNPVAMVDPDGREHNGGFCIKNNTKKTLVLGSCSGLYMTEYTLWGVKTNKIDVYDEREATDKITLEPGQMLQPYIDEYKTTTKDGNERIVYEFKARIIDIDGITVVKDNLQAYDVDYVEVGEGLTFKVNNKRYNSDESDMNAESPATPLGKNTIKLQPSEYRAIEAKLENKLKTRTKVVKSGTIEFKQEKELDDIEINTEGLPYLTEPNINIKESFKHNGEKK